MRVLYERVQENAIRHYHLSSYVLFGTISRDEIGVGHLPDGSIVLGGEKEQDPIQVYQKAAVLNRFIAKSLDFLIVLGLGEMASPYGFWAGLWYILVADGFAGRSIGKRLIGLQAWVSGLHMGAGFKESIVRNVPIAVAYLIWQVPYLGWLGAVAILSIEALLIIGNDRGLRIGDELAHTQVVNDNIFDLDSSA